MYSREEVLEMSRIKEYRQNHRKYLEDVFEKYFDQYYDYINKKALYLKENYGKIDMNKLLNMPFNVWYETYILSEDTDLPEPNVILGTDNSGFSDPSLGEVFGESRGNYLLYKLYCEGLYSLTNDDKKKLGLCK